MRTMSSRKKGISLIVLVITIIVIIILAVAVILSIANNNPIENANQAKMANNEKTLEETANLVYSDWYTKKKLDSNFSQKPGEYVEEALKKQGFELEDISRVAATDDGVSLVTIPKGFKHVSVLDSEGNETSTGSKGYVIEDITDTDTKGNQFVWVPVNDINNFVREEGYRDGNLEEKLTKTSEPYFDACDAEKNEYNEMKESVSKYHGFYIGRYEASLDTNKKARSIAGVEPYHGNEYKWSNSKNMQVLSGGVREKASNVYSVEKSSIGSAVSTLVYGVQWDQTVRWLSKNYPDIEKNSTNYGNYKNANFMYIGTNGKETEKLERYMVIIPTGSTEHSKTNNIYDMCGNIDEWTMEAREFSTGSRSIRGGNFIDNGGSFPVSFRNAMVPSTANNPEGFRIALYIK